MRSSPSSGVLRITNARVCTHCKSSIVRLVTHLDVPIKTKHGHRSTLMRNAQGAPLPGMTSVADNLPDYMQYLDLIRDCIAVFSLTPLPPNYVEIAHPFNDSIVRDFTYSAYDNKQHGPHVKSHLYLPESHARDKKKTTERRNRKKGKGKESSQESASRENSSQELASAGTSAASDSSATSLGEVLEDGSDEEVEADETGDEQILLASTGENEEIATFSRNDEAAKSAADSAFVRAKPGKGQL